MADLVLRIPKGSALTYQEADDNWSNLNEELATTVRLGDYSPSHSVLVQQSGTGSPTALQVANNTLLGRLHGGGSEIEALTASEVRTLINVADGATVNATDADLRDRATHTGAQAIATVTGLQTALDGKLSTAGEAATVATINGRIAQGANVTITGAGTAASPYTIAAAGGGGSALGNFDFWEESWIGNSATGAGTVGFAAAAVSSGTNNTALPAASLQGYNPFGAFIRSNTAANGGFRYHTTSQVGQYFGSATAKFRARFLWRTSFTGRTVRIGFHDTATVTDAVDGAYFEVLDAVCSAKTASNSTRTTNATTVSLSLDTPYSFEIDVAANGASARFRVFAGTNETPILDVTNDTNMPTTTARVFGAGLIATEVSTTANDIGVIYSLGMGTIAGFNKVTGRT